VPDDSAAKQAAISALLASGFPFQTAISEVVRHVPDWKIEAEEFPWRDDSGADRFLDLVISKQNLIITIECKKTQKDIFTFLQPTGTGQKKVNRSRCLYLHQIEDSSMRIELFCGDWDIEPYSLESAFCVVSTSESGKDQRLLEKDAQLLVRGTDAYGRHLTPARQTAMGVPDRLIVPLIVTNARLFNANYDPRDVSLDTGQLLIKPVLDISPIECVRFRKAFTAANRDVGDRTVFVVAATSLEKVLHELDETFSRYSPRHSIRLPN
jgi:hypothetical protein